MKNELLKLIGILALLASLLWGWYEIFPGYMQFAWLFAVVMLVSVFGRDFKFFEKKGPNSE